MIPSTPKSSQPNPFGRYCFEIVNCLPSSLWNMEIHEYFCGIILVPVVADSFHGSATNLHELFCFPFFHRFPSGWPSISNIRGRDGNDCLADCFRWPPSLSCSYLLFRIVSKTVTKVLLFVDGGGVSSFLLYPPSTKFEF